MYRRNHGRSGKKKAKPNGFSLFAKQFAVIIINRLDVFSNQLNLQHEHNMSVAFEDLIDIVKPHWEGLSEEAKQKYKNKAKGIEGSASSNEVRKQPLKPAEVEALQRKEKHETMMDEVRKIVQNAYDLGRKL
jgi:hypothetical protein